MRTTKALKYALLGGALALGACDSKDPQEPAPTPAIALTLGAASVEVVRGGVATLPVSITRTGGFTGPVSVTAESLPGGVTAGGITIPAGSTTGALEIVAAAPGAAATATVTVRASGTGVTAQTGTFALTVREPPGFTLAVSPTTVSLQPGGSGTATVSIARTGGFTGPVALTATGQPAGMTLAFEPASVTGNSAVLTVTAAPTTAVGTHAITLQANAAGMTQRTAALSVQVTAVPSIGITLAPTSLSVAQGTSGTVTVNLARGGGFAGAVSLTAENLPAGVTVAPATIAAGATSATLSVSAAAGASPGTSNITIRATAAGVADVQATLALTVTQASGYTLALTPSSVSVQQGAGGSATVNLTRTGGFAGAVALSATGAPSGMTVTFSPASVTGSTSTLNVATTASVPVGTHTVTVRGTASGLPDVTTALNVTVTSGSQSGGNVLWRFCPSSGLPLWVAARSGDASWTRVAGNASNEFSFQVDTRGGIAYVLPRGGGYDLTVQYGTREELQLMGAALCESGTGATKTINGTVVGMGDLALIALGSSSSFVMGSTNFQLTDVPPGTVDLVGTRIAISGAGALVTNRLFIQRGLNPPNNSSVTVDFNGQNSFAPGTANLTLSNLSGDAASVYSLYRTANGTTWFLGLEADPSTTGTRPYTGVPADRQAAGDLHWVMAFASAPGKENPTDQRTAMHIFRTLENRTISFGPALSPVQASVVASQPYARIRLSYQAQQEYSSYFNAQFMQDTRDASVSMSAGYLGGSSAVVLEVPDFTAVAGWDNTWGLRAGAATDWRLEAQGRVGAGGNVLNPWVDNTVFRSAERSGRITP
jgi:hypothetical protein